MSLTIIAFGLLALTGAAHILTIAVATIRLRRPAQRLPLSSQPPGIALVRPVCGVENGIEETIRSSFRLTYPKVEVIFCCDDADDPVVPLVNRLIAEYPNVDARLIIGRDRIGANPKLNNCVKGWRAARSDWIIMSDSNALLPPDFVESLLARWRSDTGVVSTAAEAAAPEGFASELECAFMNSMQARWVLAADSLGMGFALGKTLLWRRDVLEGLGGLKKLAAEAAEDIASTWAARGAGLGIRLAQKPVPQPIGRRSFATVWQRQVRWARLRRAGLRHVYFPEILSGAALPMASIAVLAATGAIGGWLAAGLVAGWYGLEAVVTRAGGWHLSWRMPFAWMLRDLLLPAVWVMGWVGNTFEWRGNVMTVSRNGAEPAEAEGR